MSLMNLLYPGRRNLKNMAAMSAASWAMGRMARRSPRAARGMRLMNTASWALPLGMMAYDQMRSRRTLHRDGMA